MSPKKRKEIQLALESFSELIQNAFQWICLKEKLFGTKIVLSYQLSFLFFLERRFFSEIVDGLMLPVSISCQELR